MISNKNEMLFNDQTLKFIHYDFGIEATVSFIINFQNQIKKYI